MILSCCFVMISTLLFALWNQDVSIDKTEYQLNKNSSVVIVLMIDLVIFYYLLTAKNKEGEDDLKKSYSGCNKLG